MFIMVQGVYSFPVALNVRLSQKTAENNSKLSAENKKGDINTRTRRTSRNGSSVDRRYIGHLIARAKSAPIGKGSRAILAENVFKCAFRLVELP